MRKHKRNAIFLLNNANSSRYSRELTAFTPEENIEVNYTEGLQVNSNEKHQVCLSKVNVCIGTTPKSFKYDIRSL